MSLAATGDAGNHLSQESDGSVEVAAARLVFVIPLYNTTRMRVSQPYAAYLAVCGLVSVRFSVCSTTRDRGGGEHLYLLHTHSRRE